MPYVDQGESKPLTLPPIVPFVAVLVAMGVTIVLFWFFYTKFNFNQWLAPMLAGPMIGGAFFATKKRPIPRTGLIVIAATVLACLVGYVLRHILWIKWLDPNFRPSVGHAMEWLFSNDIMSILLIGMSAYLAFIIATLPKAPPAQGA